MKTFNYKFFFFNFHFSKCRTLNHDFHLIIFGFLFHFCPWKKQQKSHLRGFLTLLLNPSCALYSWYLLCYWIDAPVPWWTLCKWPSCMRQPALLRPPTPSTVTSPHPLIMPVSPTSPNARPAKWRPAHKDADDEDNEQVKSFSFFFCCCFFYFLSYYLENKTKKKQMLVVQHACENWDRNISYKGRTEMAKRFLWWNSWLTTIIYYFLVCVVCRVAAEVPTTTTRTCGASMLRLRCWPEVAPADRAIRCPHRYCPNRAEIPVCRSWRLVNHFRAHRYNYFHFAN